MNDILDRIADTWAGLWSRVSAWNQRSPWAGRVHRAFAIVVLVAVLMAFALVIYESATGHPPEPPVDGG